MATTAVYEGEFDVPEDAIKMIDEAVIASKLIDMWTHATLVHTEFLFRNYQMARNPKQSAS